MWRKCWQAAGVCQLLRRSIEKGVQDSVTEAGVIRKCNDYESDRPLLGPDGPARRPDCSLAFWIYTSAETQDKGWSLPNPRASSYPARAHWGFVAFGATTQTCGFEAPLQAARPLTIGAENVHESYAQRMARLCTLGES